MATADYQIPGSENDITKQPWYWGKFDKKQVACVLMEGDHGHFLVRDSTRDGEYTLVVRTNEKVRSIRIHRGPSGYGVMEDSCDYASVADLIHHLQNNPDVLHRIFPQVDLLHAVTRPDESQRESTYELLNQLVSKNKDLILQQDSYTNHVRRRKLTVMEMQQCKTTIASLNAVLSLFEEHLALLAIETSNRLMEPEARARSPREESLALNRATLHDRVQTVRTRVRKEQGRYKELQTTANLQLEEVRYLKPQLSKQQQELTLLRLRVEERGIEQDYLELLLKEEKRTNLSHYSRCFWFVECDRAGSERMLAGQMPGTFLVRPKKEGGLALSIVCEEGDMTATRHCLIFRDPSTGNYGFHTQFCIFPSVEDLVMKHQTISLRFYNSSLDVCLTNPVNYPQGDDD